MVDAMLAALCLWDKSEACRSIILKSVQNDRHAFCAGGDVVGICKLRGKLPQQTKFFQKEYALNHLIATHSKPIIVLMDGVTFGGGVGLSIHAPFRVATENTAWAMPEAAIGFFTDVGTSFCLPRLSSGVGLYLGLTGHRLTGSDAYFLGIATHFIPSWRLADVEATISRQECSADTIDRLLLQFSFDEQSYNPAIEPYIQAIEQYGYFIILGSCFGSFDIFVSLRKLGILKSDPDPKIREWAAKTSDSLMAHSPTSLAAICELLKQGRASSLKQCLDREFALAQGFLAKVDDFYEGVSSRLVQKSTEKPRWNPADIEKIQPSSVQSLFIPIIDGAAIPYVKDLDFSELPHQHYALPSFSRLLDEKRSISKHSLQRDSLDILLQKYGNRLGLRRRLEQVL